MGYLKTSRVLQLGGREQGPGQDTAPMEELCGVAQGPIHLFELECTEGGQTWRGEGGAGPSCLVA